MSILPTQSDTSRLVYGCMHLGGSWDQEEPDSVQLKRAELALEAALDVGIKTFDHADIYTLGKSESVFGKLLASDPALRGRIKIQSKCGIRLARAGKPKRYDLSAAHIIDCVDASLRRLQTDYLDLLLLHRPDPLSRVDEIATAWSRLESAGKVRSLGVSNMHAGQIQWLQSALSTRLCTNQLEMSLGKLDWLDSGTCFNDMQGRSSLPWAGTLEYCQNQQIQLQAWAPLAQGRFSGSQAETDRPSIDLVRSLAASYGVAAEAIVLAWLMRHPAQVQPVIGSLTPARIRACAQAEQIEMTAEHWYQLYQSARGNELP